METFVRYVLATFLRTRPPAVRAGDLDVHGHRPGVRVPISVVMLWGDSTTLRPLSCTGTGMVFQRSVALVTTGDSGSGAGPRGNLRLTCF